MPEPKYGQASVHITVSKTLLQQYGDLFDVHICSMGKVASRCPEKATFHKLDGTGMAPQFIENWEKKYPGDRPATGGGIGHRPTFLGTFLARFLLKDLLFPWSDAEYIRLAHETERLIAQLKPDLVVVDPLCFWGIDALNRLDVRAVTLSPVSWGMHVRVSRDERKKPFMLQWPSLGTGYPSPLPCYLVPLNLIQALTVVFWMMFLSPGMRSLNRTRSEAGYTEVNPLFKAPKPVICPGTIALDFAGVPTPKIIPVGPLVQAYPPIEQEAAELAAWLDKGGDGKGKTILIMLGSHFRFDEKEVRAMMAALQCLLEKRQDLQVLWKLVPYDAHDGAKGDLEKMVQQMKGMMRVVDWLKADPPALLQSGYVGAFVHHGGGNSYHEALGTGVPQIIIAGWLDCYDFAQRATEAGVGVWANKAAAPSIAAQSIQTALLRVLGTIPSDPIAAEYRDRAASAALIARDASSMPRVPGGEEDLQAVQIARERLALKAQAGLGSSDRDGDDGKVYVDGRNVAAEWIFRYAVSGLQAADICD